VEELVSNGIQQLLFITGRSKASIDSFSTTTGLFRILTETNKQELLKEVDFEALQSNFLLHRNGCKKDSATPVLCGENFAGEEPFLVALGDSILGLRCSLTRCKPYVRCIRIKRASCVIAVEEVPGEETRHYGMCSRRTAMAATFSVCQPGREARPENGSQ